MLTYAHRGFGVRILPSYIKALEAGGGKRKDPVQKKIPLDLGRMEQDVKEQYDNLESFRKPQGGEPGLKTLKRVAQMGRNSVKTYVDVARTEAGLNPVPV